MKYQTLPAGHLFFVACLAIINPFCSAGQAPALKVINSVRVYTSQIRSDSNTKMVSLRQTVPGLRLHLPYATRDNFTGKELYADGKDSYLRLPAANAIREVHQLLAEKGLGLLVWDAYRPYAATKKMWQLVHDERYVANPAKGSGHNRGIAIDLTIVDESTGEPLDMGTGFDHFSDTAHHDFQGLSQEQQQNRALLKQLMEAHGFRALQTEWWHYSWHNTNFDVLNLRFRELARLAY